jgi:cysteinyl-tRNA synthetase
MYFCALTVYNYTHIGNFRTYFFQDVLTRILEIDRYNLYIVRNITDVDDKTIRNSITNNLRLKTFPEKWTKNSTKIVKPWI